MTSITQNPCDLSPREIMSLLRAAESGAALIPFGIHAPTGSVKGIDGLPLQIPHYRIPVGSVGDLQKWIGEEGFQKLRSLIERVRESCDSDTSNDNDPYCIITHILTAHRPRHYWKVRLIPLRPDENGRATIIAGTLRAADYSAADVNRATAVCPGKRHVIRFACDDDGHWTEAGDFSISGREMIVLRMTISGASCQQIAGKLEVSEATVKNDKKSVCLKTGARNTIDAIRILHSHAIISLE